MGYRIRILGKNLQRIPLNLLQEVAEPAVFEVNVGVGDEWEALILKHSSDAPIALIERFPVEEGEHGGEVLKDFIEDVPYYEPASAAEWLKDYLPTVKVIYSFQLLNGTAVDNGFELMHRVYGEIWRQVGGILHADEEGFSNEQGYSILWQFSDDAAGPWKVGVLGEEGRWIHFEMDLGDEEHRRAFWQGKVPQDAKPRLTVDRRQSQSIERRRRTAPAQS